LALFDLIQTHSSPRDEASYSFNIRAEASLGLVASFALDLSPGATMVWMFGGARSTDRS
jgi:hypothetical protein